MILPVAVDEELRAAPLCPECDGAGTRVEGDRDAVCYACDGSGVEGPRCARPGCPEAGRFVEGESPVCRWHKPIDAVERYRLTGYASVVDAL